MGLGGHRYLDGIVLVGILFFAYTYVSTLFQKEKESDCCVGTMNKGVESSDVWVCWFSFIVPPRNGSKFCPHARFLKDSMTSEMKNRWHIISSIKSWGDKFSPLVLYFPSCQISSVIAWKQLHKLVKCW